jgi:two-component system cell cycle response regulator DivK
MVKTILIVEDNEMNMRLCSDLLQASGYKILQSVDGTDTMQLTREHRPDLIVMDIQLPHVSGAEYTKMLKADDDLKDIPVLAVTAFAMVGDEMKILKAGCDAYLCKPISILNFLETVTKLIK